MHICNCCTYTVIRMSTLVLKREKKRKGKGKEMEGTNMGKTASIPVRISARPYESCKISKGRPRRNAFSDLVHRQYKLFPGDRFLGDRYTYVYTNARTYRCMSFRQCVCQLLHWRVCMYVCMYVQWYYTCVTKHMSTATLAFIMSAGLQHISFQLMSHNHRHRTTCRVFLELSRSLLLSLNSSLPLSFNPPFFLFLFFPSSLALPRPLCPSVLFCLPR